MPTSDFSRNSWFLNPNFQGGKCPFSPPRGRPCDHWLFYVRFHKQG